MSLMAGGKRMKEYTELVLNEEDTDIRHRILGREFCDRCISATATLLDAKYSYKSDNDTDKRHIIKNHNDISDAAFSVGIPIAVARDIYIHALSPVKYKDKLYGSKWYLNTEVRETFKLTPKEMDTVMLRLSDKAITIGRSTYVRGSDVNSTVQDMKNNMFDIEALKKKIKHLKSTIREELAKRGYTKPMPYSVGNNNSHQLKAIVDKMEQDLIRIKKTIVYMELDGYIELATFKKSKVRAFTEAVSDSYVTVGANKLFVCDDMKEVEEFVIRVGA